MSTPIRPDLESLPPRLRSLPVDERGYPVPYFVAWKDGKPEFRAMDGQKLADCIRFKKCWVCGDFLGKHMTFVIGPMCCINRTSAEPPSHIECAQWSARNCPFLSNANRKRREDDQINNDTLIADAAGFAITRNPGVTALWTTRNYQRFSDGRGGMLLRIGDPERIEFYANGQLATRAEVDASITSGFPILEKMAASDGDEAMQELTGMRKRLERLLYKAVMA